MMISLYFTNWNHGWHEIWSW